MDNININYEYSTINPQVIFLFDENKNVKRTIFLSKDSVIENSFVYGVYNYLSLNNTKFLTQPEYVNDHIILSFNIEQARGYIKNLLQIDENILLFSIWHNLDYYYNNNEIFDPYNIKNNLLIESTDNKKILYMIYLDITDGGVFCVTTNEYTNTSLARDGMYYKLYTEYIQEIISNIYKNNYKLSSMVKESEEYSLTNNFDDIIKLSNINKYTKTLCIGVYDKFYIKGDKITILDNTDYSEYVSLYIYIDENNTIKIVNDTLFAEKLNYFTDILKEEEIKNIIIKSNSPKSIIYIYFDTFLDSNINIQYDLKFFLNVTNTRNIFIDMSYKINIMTSKNHISYRSFNIDTKLCKYLSLLILGYNHIFNRIQKHSRLKKIDELYPSRYCQNYKDVKRQPVLIDSIDENYLIKISDKYYVGREDTTRTYQRKGTKKIFDPYKYGDVYIDDNGLKYQCSSIYYSNIGFLNNIYLASGGNTCYPCCYSKQKSRDEIFESCVFNKEIILEDKINPIIVNYGRIILSKNGLSKLSPKLNNILNSNSKIDIIKHTNRIDFADNYTIIMAYQPTITIRNFDDMYSFIINNNAIVVNDNIVYTDKKILKMNNSDVNIFIIIQNRIHQLKNINKQSKLDDITVEKIDDKKIKILKKYFNIINNITNPIVENGISVTDDICKIDGEIIVNKNIKYFTEYNNISLKPKSTSEYIEKYFKQYFDTIYTNNIKLFIKIFITKIMHSIKESDVIKTDYSKLEEKLNNITHKQISSILTKRYN
ncbi:VETF-L early transcription factor large [Mythimna separata entomopoxvirus 'L']|uniref:Early transcription factor 82 kDa subunit n=1 Tax=Mythimna separata entomopoxvirus 'L' TaxID=1293572 RepID=A0A916NYH9_9POXV|nr:VETF-L early transcription factor large [Mythimna separata entomopoxvirus 'L']CCU56319.1 VETF-L early transcription factor large [Mythimna separata entomopoxvirus 'L']